MALEMQVSIQGDDELHGLFASALYRLADLRKPFEQTALFVVREASRHLRTRRSEDATGALRRSLTYRVGTRSFWAGSQLVYAAIQQLGGVVLPKTVKMLAIPLLPHLRRRHVWPRDLTRDGWRIWRWNSGGRLYLMGASGQAKGKDSKVQLLYRLVPRVTIKGRPYLGWTTLARDFLIRSIKRSIGIKE